MTPLSTPAQTYRSRRENLARHVFKRYGGGVVLMPTAPEIIRNHTTAFPYRAESSFYYLTGFPEPEALLALVVDGKGKSKHFLFCRDKNLERETWEGARFGVACAKGTFLFDRAFPIEKQDSILLKQLANAPALITPIGLYRDWDEKITKLLRELRAGGRAGQKAPTALIEARDLIAPMRMLKDAHEISLMRRAAQISAKGHIRAMETACVGRYEYEIEAALTHSFIADGARAHAYPPIVASGENACVLHYTANNRLMKRGELLLIDAGCEYQNYAGDITRTFPTGKRFSAAQRDIYQLTLAAQESAIAALKVGAPFSAYHEAAARVLTQGLIDLKLIKGSLAGAIETKKYRRFYMHGAGHWLGLDVHDVGHYAGKNEQVLLEAGMVVTVEPGLYFREGADIPPAFHHTGVRIEDDVLVTKEGVEVLSADAPKTLQAIETLRARVEK